MSTFPVSFLIASAIRLGPKPRLIMSSSMYRAVSSSVSLKDERKASHFRKKSFWH